MTGETSQRTRSTKKVKRYAVMEIDVASLNCSEQVIVMVNSILPYIYEQTILSVGYTPHRSFLTQHHHIHAGSTTASVLQGVELNSLTGQFRSSSCV